MKTFEFEEVLKAARELNSEEIPDVWLDYIRAGWRIRQVTSPCGGKWAWYKPRPSGELIFHGCVCHSVLDGTRVIDTKMYRSPLAKKMLTEAGVSQTDVGKIFYFYPGDKTGHIVSSEELSRMNPALVGWWFWIDEFDAIK
jgi:hypothetical protein